MSWIGLIFAGVLPACTSPPPLDRALATLGGPAVTQVTLTGTGTAFAIGQAPAPDEPWPRFTLASYRASIDYAAPAIRIHSVLEQAEAPPRGGGGQPLVQPRHVIEGLHGATAWNESPTPGADGRPDPVVTLASTWAAAHRRQQILLTPLGFVRAARAAGATVNEAVRDGRPLWIVTFIHDGARVAGAIDEDGQVTEVESQLAHPLFGDMPVKVTFTGYREFGGLRHPAHILQVHGGFPTLELSVTAVEPNASVPAGPPEPVTRAAREPIRVETEQLERGVWYLKGGSHHSVLVEFADHLVLVEAPLDDARSMALTAAIAARSSKPVRFVVNTHHHADHAGGLRTFAATGATILTHALNVRYFNRLSKAARLLVPDRLAATNTPWRIEGIDDRRVLTDGRRTLEVLHVRGNGHDDGLLMAYLPRERLLVEADAFTPGPFNAPPAATGNPFTANLLENIRRLTLRPRRIVPLHGRVVALEDLEIAGRDK